MHSSDEHQLSRSLRLLSSKKETRRVEDRVFGAKEAADALLPFLVNGLRATIETNRGHAVTEFDETYFQGEP